MFGITSKDAENLAIGFRIWKKMRVLHIHNSKLDDDKFYTLYEGLKNLNHLGIYIFFSKIMSNFWKQFNLNISIFLESIKLQNNVLTDDCMSVMMKLFGGPSTIKILDLTNNK